MPGNFIDTSTLRRHISAEASPEPVHPLVNPELEDGHHLLLHRGVPVVEVGLLLATSLLMSAAGGGRHLGEGVVVELLPPLAPLPGRASEHTHPVVGDTVCHA